MFAAVTGADVRLNASEAELELSGAERWIHRDTHGKTHTVSGRKNPKLDCELELHGQIRSNFTADDYDHGSRKRRPK